jgi:hypothetical protein
MVIFYGQNLLILKIQAVFLKFQPSGTKPHAHRLYLCKQNKSHAARTHSHTRIVASRNSRFVDSLVGSQTR